jgi:hypothetical protein
MAVDKVFGLIAERSEQSNTLFQLFYGTLSDNIGCVFLFDLLCAVADQIDRRLVLACFLVTRYRADE